MVTTPKAYRDQLAYELARWWADKAPADTAADADAIIVLLEDGSTATTVDNHPMVEWVSQRFEVHWLKASYAVTGYLP